MRKGFTLVEVVTSILITGIALMALMLAFAHGLSQIESSRNTAQATADARVVLEEMHRLSESNLASVIGTDWAQFASTAGLTSLQDETVTVTYLNQQADPLEVTVVVGWTEKVRARTITFTELLTRR